MVSALQLQAPGVGAESEVAFVERGDVGGDQLVLGVRERALGEVKLAHVEKRAHEVGLQAHGADDFRYATLINLLRLCVDFGQLPSGVFDLNPGNAWHRLLPSVYESPRYSVHPAQSRRQRCGSNNSPSTPR